MWWNEHGIEAWSLSLLGLGALFGYAYTPLGYWTAYAIGWTMCLVGAPGIDCSYY